MGDIVFECLYGRSAGREVLLGFAPSALLHQLSFADVLDEDTGRGYQRRFNAQHSLDFRKYVQGDSSATIPLTFNLRHPDAGQWSISEIGGRLVNLRIDAVAGRVFSQVDCQHRLGHLADLSVELPFMTFLGLSEREEMEVFNVINSKAKGLSASLLDFHDARLAADLAEDRLELFVALFLRNEAASPWFRQLDLGGDSTSGLSRRASLRTMQKAIKVFLTRTKIQGQVSPDTVAQIVFDFWLAVSIVLPEQWNLTRKHILNKGIGVYALMELAADICLETRTNGCIPDRTRFASELSDFASEFDWTTNGPFKGLGGESGVKAAIALIRAARKRTNFKMVSNG
jgi:DNA sulfur modification protein DndB